MRSTYQAVLLLVAAGSIPASLAQPTGSSVSDVTLPTDTGTPDLNTALNVTDTTEEEDARQNRKCFHFTSENPNWKFTTDPPWTGHGTFSNGRTICVPTNQQGGAMFIGSEDSPQGGNTKFECTFPAQGRANCDLSLVDGYSLSVKCDLPRNQHIGGTTNLWHTGKPCVASGRENEGICVNAKGYAPRPSDVTAFFQEGQMNGNNYCIWHACKRDDFFPVTAPVKCHVSGSHGPGN